MVECSPKSQIVGLPRFRHRYMSLQNPCDYSVYYRDSVSQNRSYRKRNEISVSLSFAIKI